MDRKNLVINVVGFIGACLCVAAIIFGTKWIASMGADSASELPPGAVFVDSVAFPRMQYMDGAYNGVGVASDGTVYFALCTHDGVHDAKLMALDPVTGQVREVVDAGDATGDTDGSGLLPQGKIHSKIIEGKDGRIYFATHLAFPETGKAPETGPDKQYGSVLEYLKAIKYPGGYFMAYDPVSGNCEVLGKVAEGEGIITMTMDTERSIVYGLTYPSGDLVRCDVDTGKVTNLGKVTGDGVICRTLVVDGNGMLWGSRERDEIFRYDPESGAIETVDAKVPGLDPVDESWNARGRRIWRTAVWHPEQRKIYGVHAGTSQFFSFDPATLETELIGPACPEEFNGREMDIYGTLTLCIGADGKLYYTPALGLFDFFLSRNINKTTPLMCLDPSTGAITNLGSMFCEDKEMIMGLQASDSADDGTLYFLGAVEKKNGSNERLDALSKCAGRPYELRLIEVKPGG